MPTQLSIDRGNLALPVLVRCAEERRTITYTELGQRIGGVAPRPLSWPLEYIRDHVCRPRKLPPINVLVVKIATKMPGPGFLREGTDGVSRTEYRRRFEELRDQVFAYDGWRDLLRELGLHPEGGAAPQPTSTA